MCSQTRTHISNHPWNDDLVQDCSMSIVNTVDILQTCTKPLIYTFGYCCDMVRYSYVLLTSALQKLRTLVTGKIHPISCPHGPAMGCLLWRFSRKNWPVITSVHNYISNYSQNISPNMLGIYAKSSAAPLPIQKILPPFLFSNILMAWCKTAVTPQLIHRSYYSLVLSPRYEPVPILVCSIIWCVHQFLLQPFHLSAW